MFSIDTNRNYVYTEANNGIELYRYQPNYDEEESLIHSLNYVNCIPVVKSYENKIVKPTNLLIYSGGEKLLLSDSNTFDSILKLDIKKGVITNENKIHTSFSSSRGDEDVVFRVNKFDYNNQDDLKQYDKYSVGINSNHIMRFDLDSGKLCHSKSYQKNPNFTSVTTDIDGNVIVGDIGGTIRLFSTIGKKVIKIFNGLGDRINELQVSISGDVVATTDNYFVFLPDFTKKGEVVYYKGKLSDKIVDKLEIEGEKVVYAQFYGIQEDIISFSMGNYLFHWKIKNIIQGKCKINVYNSDSKILYHKFNSSTNDQFVLDKNNPVHFNV